jgi:uncharacterized membrane protein HdeD (DUF308 family)
MNSLKLFIGVLSVALSQIVMNQSFALFQIHALLRSESVSAATGLVVSVLMMMSGIFLIISKEKKHPFSGTIVLYLAAGLNGVRGYDELYDDLMYYAILCFIFAAVLIIFGIIESKRQPKSTVFKGNFQI